MPFQKGRQKTGGKKKGSSNKATRDIKEAYRMLIEDNLPNITIWLNKIAEKNPAQALNILVDLSEYIIPKLARSQVEHSNPDGTMKQEPTIIVTSNESMKELKELING